MATRNVALVLFTDGENIIVQVRGKHSRVGEKYGFIGGEIEEGVGCGKPKINYSMSSKSL